MKIRLLWAFIVVFTVATAIIGCGKPNKEVEVPIILENASNVGSLQVEVSYDASTLKAIEVKAEDLGENAMVEANLDTPGYIIIGIVDSSGINGSGSIVSISFDVLEKDTSSPVTIKNAAAHDANTLVDLPVSLTPGNFKDGEISTPSINFK